MALTGRSWFDSLAQSKGFLDMHDPLFYILAPFLLGFGLFAVFLVVSIILKDPARPFRMFKAPPIDLEGAGRRAQGAESTDEATQEHSNTEEDSP